MKKVFALIIFIFLFANCFFVIPINPVHAAGATLFLSPASGTVALNRNITVKIMVDSGGGVGINAAEGVIKYDPAYLNAVSISDASSIFKLWTTDPAYSNSAGTITFGGGSPGAYKGNGGEIFNITFTAKKAGETSVTFSSGIVLAADGKGTNVFSGFGNAKYVIGEKKEEVKPVKKEEVKEDTKGIKPPLPEVSSDTHPKDNIWYAVNEPEFSWKVLSDLTGVSYAVTDSPDSDPGSKNDGIIENIILEEQADGEWYFHIKYQNRYGWGQIAHKKFLVDVTAPEKFNLAVDNGGDDTNPSPRLRFKTEDKTSGISHYVVQIGSETIQVSADEASDGYYQFRTLAPGEYSVNLAAVDMAGNTASSSIIFLVDPLKAPIITDIPKTIEKKEELAIRGTSFYSGVTVKIYIGQAGQEAIEASVTTDNEGNWSYFHKDRLPKGNYEVWAKIIDKRGAQSIDSTRHPLTVVSPSIICAYGWWIIALLLLLITALVLYIWYEKNRNQDEKNRIRKENDEVKSKLSKIFAALREEVDELIELADKRPGYSESERKVKEKLQESLDISEEFIAKEVADVDKEINLKDKESKK